MPTNTELAEYLRENYGSCARGADCYWGKNEQGKDNGCLKVGWRGTKCLHWKPLGATSLDELREIMLQKYR